MHGAEQLTDEVVRRAAEGVQQEMESVAVALMPQVRAMVWVRLSASPKHWDTADEIVQAVMASLAQAMPRLENRTVGALRSALSVIVTRRVADYLRTTKRAKLAGRPVVSLDTTVAKQSVVGPLWQFLSIDKTSPVSAVGRAELVSVVLDEIGRLRDEYREVITLALFDQLTTAEIGERLGITRRAASMLLLRAIRTLRRQVTGSSQID